MTSPNAKMDVDQAGLDFITEWEGLVLKVYRDVANKKTYGVGHLVRPDEDADFPDGKPITKEFAMQTLHKDVQKVVATIRKHVKVKLNQNQFNALASFLFNVGTGAFESGSGVLTAVNSGNFSAVPAKLNEWVHVTVDGAKRVEKGLQRRRASEGDLFRSKVAQEASMTNQPQEEIPAQSTASDRKKQGAFLIFTGSAIAFAALAYHFSWDQKILNTMRQGRKRAHASQR